MSPLLLSSIKFGVTILVVILAACLLFTGVYHLLTMIMSDWWAFLSSASLAIACLAGATRYAEQAKGEEG